MCKSSKQGKSWSRIFEDKDRPLSSKHVDQNKGFIFIFVLLFLSVFLLFFPFLFEILSEKLQVNKTFDRGVRLHCAAVSGINRAILWIEGNISPLCKEQQSCNIKLPAHIASFNSKDVHVKIDLSILSAQSIEGKKSAVYHLRSIASEKSVRYVVECMIRNLFDNEKCEKTWSFYSNNDK